MRICLICVELFAWGKYGGFGRATRTLGSELAKRGHKVFAVVPRRGDQNPVEYLDGITVLGFAPWCPVLAAKFFSKCNADIYHSCEPSMGTFLARQVMPDRKHMVTFRDPRDTRDWRLELALPSANRSQVLMNWLYEYNPLVKYAVRSLDAHYVAFEDGISKVKHIFGDLINAKFLPTPVCLPPEVKKAGEPTVCSLGRLDRRKRPELFFELAAQFPNVHFIAVGASRDKKWEKHLRETYRHLPNLEIVGFVDQFQSDRIKEILSKSWILVNTATREGLPNAFLEAGSYGCAILSGIDTDGFTSQFGYHVQNDDFGVGLSSLLHNNHWRHKGLLAREYISSVFEIKRAVNLHIEAYRRLLGYR